METGIDLIISLTDRYCNEILKLNEHILDYVQQKGGENINGSSLARSFVGLDSAMAKLKIAEESIRNFRDEYFKNAVGKDNWHDELIKKAVYHEEDYCLYKESHPEAKEIVLSEETLMILRKRLRDIDMSTRLYNALRCADVDILYDLLIIDKEKLLKMMNFGKKSIEEMNKIVDSYGLKYDYYIRYDRKEKVFYTLVE